MARDPLTPGMRRSLPRRVCVGEVAGVVWIQRYWPPGMVAGYAVLPATDAVDLAWADHFWTVLEALMKRPTRPGESLPAGAAAPGGTLAESHPLLCEHLTATTYEDGTPRQTSTVLAFAQDGLWKACLRDREEQRCLWVAASGYELLIDALEAMLGDPEAIWRDDRASGQPAAARQRKKT